MEKTLVFTHSLDLALRLVDTTNGRNVQGIGVHVYIDGTLTRFAQKADSVLIFQNLGKRTFQLEVTSPAYEKAEVAVDLDSYGKALPLLEIHLIPSSGYPGGVEFLSLEGVLPGVADLTAIRMGGDNPCLIREFDPRRRLATIFNPHHMLLDRVHYALLDPDRNVYEPFRILGMPDNQKIKIDPVLEMPFKNYFPIKPLVFGRTSPDGSYCLRVRDDGESARWLIRWTENGEAKFKLLDFREQEHPKLEEGGG